MSNIKFKKEDILIIKSETKKEIIKAISNRLVELKIAKNAKVIEQAYWDREKQISTAIDAGTAIPHIMIKEVLKPKILFIKLKKAVAWDKENDVNIIFPIAMPKNSNNEHLNVISSIAKLLMNPNFVAELQKTKIVDIHKTLNKYLENVNKENNEEKKKKTTSNALRIAAVTSCPTGIAHTHLAAEALENYAKDHNIKIKVERQAAQNTESKLTKMDIDNADYILISTGRPIDGMDRFVGKKVLVTSVGAPLKDPAKIFNDLKTKAKILEGEKNNSSASIKVTPMKAIINGLSHMIPFVIVGGLFLAIALGVNGGKAPADGSFWAAILNIGLAGFSLMVVILGGFIAFAIAGRATLVPAMVLSFICNGSIVDSSKPNPFFWNYESMHFGVAHSNLGFFGAIAIGLLVGYTMKYWNTYVSTRMTNSLKSIEPILITPILFTFVGWVIFAFIGYLPLYYLSQGLNIAITKLVELRLMWIVGIILGAMMAFDMGGPVNKIAFGLGVFYIKSDPIVMGAVAAAGSVPPIGSALGYIFGRHVLRAKAFNNKLDSEAFMPGLTMGFFGITEGAIPYAIKHPKTAIISNMLGGATASAIAAAFAITDLAPHTGPLVYLVGAIGKNGITNYGYGLLYMMAILIGIVVTALSFAFLTKILEDHKVTTKTTIKLPTPSKNMVLKK